MEKSEFKQKTKELGLFTLKNIIAFAIGLAYLVFGVCMPEIINIIYWLVFIACIVMFFIIRSNFKLLKKYFQTYKILFDEKLTYHDLYGK